MKLAAIVLLAAVELGGIFGTASATVEETTDRSMIVDLEVEVRGSAESVVAHLVFGDERPIVTPLLDRGDGRFGIRTELALRNYQVVFEALGPRGETSDAVSLTRLGAELTAPPAAADAESASDDGISTETQRMGWLALALGAASLSALAFWAMGGREESDGGSSEEE